MADLSTVRSPGHIRPIGSFAPGQVRTLGSLVLGLALWEVLGKTIFAGSDAFQPFSAVLDALGKSLRSGDLLTGYGLSMAEFFEGFAAAIVIGVVVGFLIGSIPILRRLVEPWILALYATPLVALAPLFIIVFGIGLTSKAAIAFSVAVMPIILNTYAGIQLTEGTFVELARSFRAPYGQAAWDIYLPGALLYILAGIRLGIGRAIEGVVVGELFFSQAGLGYIIAQASDTFNVSLIFGGVLIFALTGLVLTVIVRLIENRLQVWRIG